MSKSITLDGKEYVLKSDVDKLLKTKKIAPTKRRIVVLQRGWVVIGLFSQKGKECHLTDASVIRKWGTKNGLGEIAEKGPLPETILDPCPDVHYHELTAIFTMDVNEENWQ